MKSDIGSFLNLLAYVHMSRLEDFIILGDFNCEIEEAAMKSFCETYNLCNLVVVPACFKLSDNHKMPVSVTRSCFPKHSSTLVKY